MTQHEFVKLVADMRSSQKDYFRTGSANALEKAKAAERKVDNELREFLHAKTLFPEMNDDPKRARVAAAVRPKSTEVQP